MAPFLDEAESLLKGSSAAGSECVGALLTTSSTAEQVYIADDGSTNGIFSLESTAQAFYLNASSSGSELATTSTAEAFYLTNQSPVWLIYKGHLPDSTGIGRGRAVALLETAGEGLMGRVDIEQPGLQVIVRGEPQHQTSTSWPEAEAKMTEIVDAVHGYTGSTLTDGTHWVGVWCESGPTFDGFDDGWRPHFSAEFRIMRQTT